MNVEPEDFQIPVPPRASPASPSDPVTLLEDKNHKSADPADVEGEEPAEVHFGYAWNAKMGWRDLLQRQALEVVLTVAALCCWTTMCVLDLSGWQKGFDSDSRVASQILSLSILAVSCIAFGTRQCCVSKILTKDPDGTAGQSRLQCQLLIFLASQWSLLCGAIIWLVFHASGERQPQVIAGLVAVFIILLLLVCSLVYMLFVQRKSSVDAPKERSNAERPSNRSHLSEDLALASVDPQADLTEVERSDALKTRIQAQMAMWPMRPMRSEDTDGAMSDNFVGHVLSTSGKSGRSSLRSDRFPLKVRVDLAEDYMEREATDGGLMRKQKSVEFEKEVITSSRGRWRPLFPTFKLSSFSNSPTPTMSRTSMLSNGSNGGELRRGVSVHSKGFRFETDEEVEQSLAKEIKRHTLEVNSVLQRSSSPSPSLGSMPSQQSSTKKVKSSRGSSSSGLSDDSGDKRSNGSG